MLNKNWQDQAVDSIEHSDTDFTGLDAQNSAIVANTFKEGTDFSNAKFNRAKLNGGVYKGCKFVNNNFASAGIGHIKFENCTFTNAEFGRTDIKEVEFKNCTFDKCNFLGTQFHTSDLYDCTFSECIFNTEIWFKSTILDTKFSKSEFNKSQFSGVLIDSVTLVDSSLLKTTFFGTQIQNSDFTNNAWLKVGFANGNSIYKTTLYNENIQQCNFGDSEWKDTEVQNSQTLSNDFSKVEMHDTDFTGVNGIGDNFATGLFTNCKFVDCDLAQANCTGAGFGAGSSIQNCTLDKLIYAFANLPKNFDEGQLKKTSQVQIKQLTDKDVKIGQPSVKLDLFKEDVTIIPSQVGTYLVTGKISLEGDISAKDTSDENIMRDIEFSTDKKNKFKVAASKELANGLADIHVESYDIKSVKRSVLLKCSLGTFNLVIDKVAPIADQGYEIQGALSSNQDSLDRNYKGYQFDGDLSLGFDIILKQQKWYQRLAKVALYEFVKTYYWQYFMTPEKLASILLTGITVTVAPELIPITGAAVLIA